MHNAAYTLDVDPTPPDSDMQQLDIEHAVTAADRLLNQTSGVRS